MQPFYCEIRHFHIYAILEVSLKFSFSRTAFIVEHQEKKIQMKY